MNNIARSLTSSLCLGALVWTATAAVPPAEQLLPADTLAVLVAPDWSQVGGARRGSALARFWDDPALRPFRDKFMARLNREVIEPIEGDLGIKLSEYTALAQGQVTLALTQNGWSGTAEPVPALLLLLDAKDRREQLSQKLAEVRLKLADRGQRLKTERIRGFEFTTLAVNLPSALPKPAGAQPSPPSDTTASASTESAARDLHVSFGQVDSLLLLSTSPKSLEPVLARLAGSGAPPLAEQTAYQRDHRARFREALAYGWVHFAPLGEIVGKLASAAASPAGSPNPLVPATDKMLGAFGLMSLRTLGFSLSESPEGEGLELFLGAPEEKRRGLFQLIATEAKDAAPPPFVPADAVDFNRWRLDGQRAWATLEAMLNEVSAGMISSFILAPIESAVQQKDPNFDFRKTLIGSLGDDLVSYSKAPRSPSLADVQAPPSLALIGSPNAERLLQSLRLMASTVLAMFPMPNLPGELKEREFLGRKIYALPLPSLPTPNGAPAPASALSLAASGGYVALSTDAAMIEEYLRSSESRPKPLAATPGLADAAQRVGGMAAGLFGYQNTRENMRVLFATLKQNPNLLGQALALTPLGAHTDAEQRDQALKEWLDFTLLPPFEQVAKYFHLSVYAGRMTSDGYSLKFFSPTPPQMGQ
ncbi:MAG: hypothetical protein FJ387_30210 [Verrucomicrobia bacterium]|nr:hypothetical protein [Verrucomicrobiota bacterium]